MIVKIVKIYLRLSLVLLWILWGQFIFGQFLGPAYISEDLQVPSYVVGTNHRVLIYCLSLPRRFPLLQLLLFAGLFSCRLWGRTDSDTTEVTQQQQQQSVSNFHSDTKGVVVDTFFFFFRLTCSVALWGGRDAANK